MTSIISRHALGGLALLLGSSTSFAAFQIPGIELIHTVPRETTLQTPDLRTATEAWVELFDKAKTSIDIGQFYATSAPDSSLETVLRHLEAAGERGVRIRFLMEEKGIHLSDAATLDRLRQVPNLTFKTLPYGKVGGGIIHAKYMVADGQRAFVGSQNFDWRALEHIHETGVLIDDKAIASQVQAIFDQDWRALAAIEKGDPIPEPARANEPSHVAHGGNYLVASPARFNPEGVMDSQRELLRLLGEAKREIRVQLLDYAPLSHGPDHTRPFYAPIDNALRAAAARGVEVRLMVSDWNTKAPDVDYLKSLAVLPNVQVRIVTLPQASSGFIPYGRVIHSKTMEIDGQVAWVGTSNWLGGYMDQSRNLEVVMHDSNMAGRIRALHEQLWAGPYAQPIALNHSYPEPHPGRP
ncbi:phospholipase D-like domain-containing protein [Pseudomonas sp. Marseille-QA0892]